MMLPEAEQVCELHPNHEEHFDEVAANKHSVNACQMRSADGRSCGSGSFVGMRGDDALVLTNAHVVGSRIGLAASARFNFGGGDVQKSGRIIMAAYSTRITADWAIVAIPNWLPPIKPAWCSRVRPSGSFYTTGAPSCVWPLRHQSPLRLLSNNNAGFAVWDKNAIGGQSGSGVWSLEDHWQRLLLTWRTGNNNGAGQPLDFIWQQAQTAIETGALLGGDLPEDAVPLSDINPDAVPGFFAESSIRSLNIWFEDQQPSEPDPGPIDPDCPPTQDKAQLIESFRKIETEARQSRLALEGSASGGSNEPSGGPTFGL